MSSELRDRLRFVGKFSGMAFSMAGAIGGGVFLGRWCDARLGGETPWCTIAGALLGTAVALWSVIRQLSS